MTTYAPTMPTSNGTITMAATAAPAAAPVTGTLTERAMLVDLTIKVWTASKHDKKISREVAEAHGSDESMGRFQKSLVAKDALESIRKIVTAANAEHRRRTLAWMDNGARILSSAGYFAYVAAMREHEEAFNAAVLAFCRAYPSYVQEARQRLNGLFDPAEYPSAAGISDKFAIGLNYFPVPSAPDFRVELGQGEVDRIRMQIEATAAEAVTTAKRDLGERIRDVVGHMAERLKGYTVTAEGVSGTFRDSLVNNVRDLVSLMPSLNVLNDPAIDALAKRLDEELCAYSPDALRASTDRRQEVAARAESILANVSDFLA